MLLKLSPSGSADSKSENDQWFVQNHTKDHMSLYLWKCTQDELLDAIYFCSYFFVAFSLFGVLQ